MAGHADHELAPTLLAMTTAEPYRRLGERLLREERFEEAVPALARAIELTPFDAASRFNLAVALRRADEPELALTALDEAEWAYSGESAYHVLRGRIWEALDERRARVLAYERALELAPGDGFVLERLEHLGALLRIEGPDGEVFWLTPGDFERVMRHELASASNDPDQLVRSATACWAAATSRSPPRRPSSRWPAARTCRAPGRSPGSRAPRSAASCRRARRWAARPRSIPPTSPSRARSCSARTTRRATCRARTPRCSAVPAPPPPGSCSATTWRPPRSRTRRSAPMRTRSTWIRRCPGAEHAREALRVLG